MIIIWGTRLPPFSTPLLIRSTSRRVDESTIQRPDPKSESFRPRTQVRSCIAVLRLESDECTPVLTWSRRMCSESRFGWYTHDTCWKYGVGGGVDSLRWNGRKEDLLLRSDREGG